MTNTQITQWLFNASRVPEPLPYVPSPQELSAAGRLIPVEYNGKRYESITALTRAVKRHKATVHGWIKQGIVKRLEEA